MKKLFLSSMIVLSLILIDSSSLFAQATMDNGAMGIVVSVYGRIRAYLPASTGTKHVERLSILVGTGPTTVFDYQNDMDTEETPALVSFPALSDFEIYGSFNNAYSAAPPNVLAKYNIYSWQNAKYAVIKFTVKNRETSAIPATIGMDMIPSLDATYGYDTVSYDQTSGVIRFHRGLGNVGLKLLSHSLRSLYSFEWYSGYQADTSYWKWLNSSGIQSSYVGGVEGPVTITSQAPININPGDSVVVYYALALAENLAGLNSAMAEAVTKYNAITSVDENESVVNKFELNQNYPNPFNPSTSISYAIPENGFVNLKIYDALGNEIAALVNEVQSQGAHSVKFEAANLTSGIYFYTLRFNNQIITNKMLLMK